MKAGFTLIELLVVLAVISLISAFVAPRIFAPFGNLKLKTAAQEIAGTLRYNRSKAVSEKINRIAVFDLDAQAVRTFSAGQLTPSDTGKGFKEAASDMTYALPPDVRIQSAVFGEDVYTAGDYPVIFYPNGSSSGGDVIIAGDSGKRFVIHIDAITGMVKLSETERDG